ncbi:extracellular solute-binding protein [Microlunatus soli]|uniref:Putative aldouronate transport system substrate-binding protein n=1 Tax=Microlunatus soli TaxID=630515 RepID=A0A1H1U8B8_9ACTN|nr:extracellular solute-binding protein [Microlunatus soli]SDS68601.1 putative aldouronate transport system substrate-binding protein [Microlunatus soli]
MEHTIATHPFSRRLMLGLSATAVGGALVGCSSQSTGSDFGKNTALKVPTHVDPPDVPGQIVSAVDGVPPGYTQLPKKLPTTTKSVPGKGGSFTTFQVNWGAPPRPKAKNKYWQELEKRLGVTYEPTLVPADAYEDKLATMISGGKIADMVFLHTDSANAQRAVQDGAFAELSAVLGGDKIKKYPNLANVPQYQWEASAINNGIYGIPVDLAYVNSLHVYRRDWAEKLGFDAAPKNADEFYQLMTGMSGSKVGSGKTYGFGGYSGGVTQFINAMFKVPNNWSESDGRLTHMIETDEYEQALTYTNKLWRGGAFHPDALSLAEQGAKDRSLFESGTIGCQVASADTWFRSGGLDAVRSKGGEGSDPQLLLPFGHDGGDYAFPSSPGFYAVVAVSAEAASDEKRLAEILSIMNYLRAPFASAEGFFLRFGLEGVNFRYDKDGAPTPITENAANGDVDGLSYTGLVPVAFFYPDDSQHVTDTVHYTEAVTKSSIKDPTVGLFADSSAKVAPKLAELTTDYVNGMVTGRKPLSALKQFRQDWRKQGGDQLRTELQKGIQAG